MKIPILFVRVEVNYMVTKGYLKITFMHTIDSRSEQKKETQNPSDWIQVFCKTYPICHVSFEDPKININMNTLTHFLPIIDFVAL